MGATSGFTMAASSIGNGVAQANAAKAQGAYQKKVAEFNSARSIEQGDEAIRKGDEEALALRRKTKKLVGSQQAAAAAQGVAVDSGTAVDIQNETMADAEIDIGTIKTNAIRAAWGFKVDALNQKTAGEFAVLDAKNKATSSLVSGGMNALSYAAGAVEKIGKNTRTSSESFDDRTPASQAGIDEKKKLGSIW